MRRRTGKVFVVTYSAKTKQLGFAGWHREADLPELAQTLDRENRWDGFVPFARGFETPQEQQRLSSFVAGGGTMIDFQAAEPLAPYVFPRTGCDRHGSTRIRFLVCSGCGHVEDIEAEADGEVVLECPGGCGQPFTPLAHPSDFTARALCLFCGLEKTQHGQHAHP